MKNNKRQHVCDTYNPQRPCCWQARVAEIRKMQEQDAERREATRLKDQQIREEEGFITRGLD